MPTRSKLIPPRTRFSVSTALLAAFAWVVSSRASPVAAHAPLEAGDIFVVGVTGGATPTVALLGLVELHEGDSVVLTDRGCWRVGGFGLEKGRQCTSRSP
jgi:hypothetical protein